jgi:hypothetical protein
MLQLIKGMAVGASGGDVAQDLRNTRLLHTWSTAHAPADKQQQQIASSDDCIFNSLRICAHVPADKQQQQIASSDDCIFDLLRICAMRASFTPGALPTSLQTSSSSR